MINFRIIANILGLLLLVEGVFMLLSALVATIYGEPQVLDISLSAGITIAVGGLVWVLTKNAEKTFGKREGYIIVSLAWVVFSFFGTLPFLFTGAISSFTDAFFETMSGFTTTGASILNNIEELSHGILFWRSITQWMGGMGIIVMSLAILPILGIGGMQLFVAEVPGPTPDKLHPRIKETAKRLWGIYIIFTVMEALLLWAGEMDLFDAINHAFTTMATGGYSTKQASIMHFTSPYTHYVIVVFMFLAGTNFTLSYFAMHFKFKKILINEEFRFYAFLILFFTIAISLGLYFSSERGAEQSFRNALFQVVSIVTTTGYATTDYILWVPGLAILIFVCMFIGGSAGSTGGGIKVVRILILVKNSFMELKRLIHRNAVIPVRFNKNSVPNEIITNVLAFTAFYAIMVILSTVVMSIMGNDLETSIGGVAATLGNIGPGIGGVGPMSNYAGIHDFGKWFLSFLMLVGRLELFTVLILFAPAFWKK